MSEKIQKVLARLGSSSRREIEKWIVAGRVKIDGNIAKLGDRITSTQQIVVDNKPINLQAPQTTQLLLYHKPIGELCTRKDPEGRPTVFDHLPKLAQGRWIVIGRLDVQTSGLLLFTNDGELANRFMHPKYSLEREYLARVYGKINKNKLNDLLQGVELEEGMAKFEKIKDIKGEGSNHWLQVIVCEGRNRLVRRLFATQDLKVNRLMRTRFGTIKLPKDLNEGEWSYIRDFSIAD